MNLQEFLSSKPLFYKEIDLERMPRAYDLIKDRIALPRLIHVVGTNGKGSTGRFLAGGLKEAGYKVGHYTSPHILRFNERIWIDGSDASDEALEEAHQRLQKLLPKEVSEELSYFEYTTFLAAVMFEGLDFAIMEAGLGGEWDATSVFPNELTLVTTIDYDHQAFLGDTIQKIATTKLNAIQKKAIVGIQVHKEVYEIAKKYPAVFLQEAPSTIRQIVRQEGLAPFFANNLSLAIAAANELGILIDPKKAVKYRLRGRMEKIGNVILDVGHNVLSAKAIVSSLQKKVILVYNSYQDKDFRSILKILAPKVKVVELLRIDDERIAEENDVIEAIKEAQLPWSIFRGLKKDEDYLVYGSFKVVEEFLRRYEREIL